MRHEEARKALLSALELDPDNAAALSNLANVEMQLGDDETALVRYMDEAVDASPDRPVLRRLDVGRRCPCCSRVSGGSTVIRPIRTACSA